MNVIDSRSRSRSRSGAKKAENSYSRNVKLRYATTPVLSNIIAEYICGGRKWQQKCAKLHGNILSVSENIAKSFRGLLFWLTLQCSPPAKILAIYVYERCIISITSSSLQCHIICISLIPRCAGMDVTNCRSASPWSPSSNNRCRLCAGNTQPCVSMFSLDKTLRAAAVWTRTQKRHVRNNASVIFDAHRARIMQQLLSCCQPTDYGS